MIKQIFTISTAGTDPWRNIALEEFLLLNVPEDSVILYLWRNHRTVVIGRNQNAWNECRVERLEADGGKVARRLSGGGAVFHDLGNVNFTFIARKADYSVERQLSVLVEAVGRLGIEAVPSGRNDVTISGRKFSGNAFYQTGDNCYHHGTILIRTDKEDLARYLKAAPAKLAGKGVDSVRSRVVNLSELDETIDVERVREAMLAAFAEVYAVPCRELLPTDLHPDADAMIERRREFFASWDWRLGRSLPFDISAERRFPWGGIKLQFQVERGRVEDAGVETDALQADFFAALPEYFLGAHFTREEMLGALNRAIAAEAEGDAAVSTAPVAGLADDLRDFLTEEFF